MILVGATYSLKQHCRVFLVQHFGVQLQCILAKCEELALIGKQNRCWRLLVVAIVARVEHLNSWLLIAL